MKKLWMDLQLFSDAGTLVNATGNYVNAYTGSTESFTPGTSDLSSLDKTYYDTTVLDNARDQLIYTQLGKHQTLPQHHGQTVEFRRWQTLGVVHRITEGVIPTGRKLSQVAMTCQLSQWGDYVAISDLMDAHSIDEPKTAAAEELGAAGGLTNDLLVRNVLMNGTNIIFSGAYNGTTFVAQPTSESDLQTKLGSYNCNLKVEDILKAVTNLKVGAKIRKDKDWIDARIYTDSEDILAGELGRMHGVRFLESNLAPVIKTYGQDYATYKTMIFAKDAFGVVDVEGGAMETIIKTKGEIGGPLEQFGTVGVKFCMAARILYQERMVTIWSGSSYSSTATDNSELDSWEAA